MGGQQKEKAAFKKQPVLHVKVNLTIPLWKSSISEGGTF